MATAASTITGWEVLMFASPFIMNAAILCIMLCIHYSSRKQRVSHSTIDLAPSNSVTGGIPVESSSQGSSPRDLVCTMQAEDVKQPDPPIIRTLSAPPQFLLAETALVSPLGVLNHRDTMSITATPTQNQSDWPIAANKSHQSNLSLSFPFANSVVTRTEPFPLLQSPNQESSAFHHNESSRTPNSQSTDADTCWTRINRSNTDDTMGGTTLQPSSPHGSCDW